jgi:SAM-dependent methyltransferase
MPDPNDGSARPDVPLPIDVFHSTAYLRHTSRRLEHLASIGLSFEGRTVFEVGAGIGDLTGFLVDRGAIVTASDARPENLAVLSARFPKLRVIPYDLEDASDHQVSERSFRVVFAYGVLYHVRDPISALRSLASLASDALLLETCVSFDGTGGLHPVSEPVANPSQAINAYGSRPDRQIVWNTLMEQFDYCYVPFAQPFHEEFPLDWSRPDLHTAPLQRAVFVGSRHPIDNPALSGSLLTRHSGRA